MFHFYGIDWSYLILVLPAIILAGIAQSNVKSTFAKYEKVRSSRGVTGAQVARSILDKNNLQDVVVERVSGHLSDHYDPRTRVVRLSDSVYGSSSIAAIGVAAHEVGHAVQHQTHYPFLGLRNAIIPLTNIGSKLSMPIILIGLLTNSAALGTLGIILFSAMTVFQLVTLPVEFNASSRAVATLDNYGILDKEELAGTKKVLSAAAMTYVAALIVSAMQLLRWVLIFGRRGRDDN